MPKHPWIEFPLCFLVIVGPLLVIYLRLHDRAKTTVEKKGDTETTTHRGWGIGVRMIQLIAVMIIAPVIAILSLEGVVDNQVSGTLLGTIVGYALGGITSAVPHEK